MVDLAVTIDRELTLEYPLVIFPGPLTRDCTAARRLLNLKIGALTIKTVKARAMDTPRPNMYRFSGGLINYDWSAPSIDTIVHDLPQLKEESNKPIFVSVLDMEPDKTAWMAGLLQDAGADLIEIPIPSAVDEKWVSNTVKAILEKISIPLAVKVGPLTSMAHVRAAVEAGCRLLSGINTIGPGLLLDVESRRPVLGAKYGYGYISGPALKPIALRVVSELYRGFKNPIIGGGGISNGRDAVEMIMAGAEAFGVLTAALIYGLERLNRIVNEFEQELDSLGYSSVSEAVGAAARNIVEKADYRSWKSSVIQEKCTGCRLCVRVCPYQALEMVDGKASNIIERCEGCGLCSSVCPVHAIRMIVEV